MSVFQYLDNSNVINDDFYDEFKNILKNLYRKIPIFGTIDAKVSEYNCKILEISPHFHNTKIHKFLNNNDLLDIHLNKNTIKNSKSLKKLILVDISLFMKRIFIQKKMLNYVKKKSIKIQIDNIDISKEKLS